MLTMVCMIRLLNILHSFCYMQMVSFSKLTLAYNRPLLSEITFMYNSEGWAVPKLLYALCKNV